MHNNSVEQLFIIIGSPPSKKGDSPSYYLNNKRLNGALSLECECRTYERRKIKKAVESLSAAGLKIPTQLGGDEMTSSMIRNI